MPSVEFTNEKQKIAKDKNFVGKNASQVTWTVDGGAPPAGFKKEPIMVMGLCVGFNVSFPTETTSTVEWSIA